MARYVDADALIDRLKFKRDTDTSRRKYCGLECAISQIQKQLVVDVQAVVRCKDCVHYDNGLCAVFSEPEIRIYERWTVDMDEDDYCSYGEKRG